jgi:SAM-dependent methyltransferase
MTTPFYAGREDSLCEIFGATTVVVSKSHVEIDGRRYPVLDDVIVTLPIDRLPPSVRSRLATAQDLMPAQGAFAEDIQFTFGAEWVEHGDLLPEHAQEFDDYFDLIDLDALGDKRVADLGCGSGRWATFLAPKCREIVLADFSEAIFVARRNLAEAGNAIFVMADVLDLPFGDGAFDLSYCLGVLHHLPVDALDATRRLAPLGPELLVYLYYALDNRPAYYRALLGAVTQVRRRLARVRSSRARSALSFAIAATVYAPLAFVGSVGGERARRYVPLADTYAGKSLKRLQQDAYDRFFTRIEQRFSRTDIRTLEDTFGTIQISDGLPYWHFVCRR